MREVAFSRGFSMPKAEFSTLSNPLSVSNLYGKGGRLHEGEEEGTSFSIFVGEEEGRDFQELKWGSEHYARVRMAHKEGYVPVVVGFSLNEESFPLLQNKVFRPTIIELGKGQSRTSLEPIQTFADLVKIGDGEVVVQAGNLTPEQLGQLNIEIGTASIGKENKRIALEEALESKAEFQYTKFGSSQTTPEGAKPGLGEGGTVLK